MEEKKDLNSEYIEEKFKRLQDNLISKIDLVLLELKYFKEKGNDLDNRVSKLEKQPTHNIKTCPNTLKITNLSKETDGIKDKIDKIFNDLEEYRMIKKYPFVSIANFILLIAYFVWEYIISKN